MDFLDIDEFTDSFLRSDSPGSLQQSLVADGLSSLGNLFPVDTWGPAKGLQPESDVLDDLLALSPVQDPLGEGSEWMENSTIDFDQTFGLTDFGESMLPPVQETVVAAEEAPPKTKTSGILHDLLVLPMAPLSQVPEHPVENAQDSVITEKDIDADELLKNLSSAVLVHNGSVSIDNSVQPEIYVGSDAPTPQDDLNESVVSNDSILDQFITSPLSVDEVESFLSGSEPSSPEQVHGDDPDYMPGTSDDESGSSKRKCSGGKAKKKTTPRAVPYEIPTEGLSKKERKKIQNRNAAIRYRMKKRGEKNEFRSEEDQLMKKNKELHEKVESVSREIKYMKDLMTEVFKAKGLKISFK